MVSPAPNSFLSDFWLNEWFYSYWPSPAVRCLHFILVLKSWGSKSFPKSPGVRTSAHLKLEQTKLRYSDILPHPTICCLHTKCPSTNRNISSWWWWFMIQNLLIRVPSSYIPNNWVQKECCGCMSCGLNEMFRTERMRHYLDLCCVFITIFVRLINIYISAALDVSF